MCFNPAGNRARADTTQEEVHDPSTVRPVRRRVTSKPRLGNCQVRIALQSGRSGADRSSHQHLGPEVSHRRAAVRVEARRVVDTTRQV